MTDDYSPNLDPHGDEEDDDEDLPEILYVDEPRNKVMRGDEVNLIRKDPTIREIMIGVGWDLKAFDSNPLDLDASVLLLDKDDQTRVDDDFIYYNNLTGCDGAVKHMGDSRTGAGEGDDEMIMIDLTGLPYDIMKICFTLSIYDAEFEGHNFSMVKNVYFRIVNQNTNHEIFRYELDEELSDHEGLIIGELERIGTEWIFHAIGDTVDGGLGKIAGDRGMIIKENMA